MKQYKASVVIPIYNQVKSLDIVINAFSKQIIPKDEYELIIIDDGSTDELKDRQEDYYICKYDLNIKLLRKKNEGRACARNYGIKFSEAEIIIFCDGDRFPDPFFVFQHIKTHENGSKIVIGASYDYFGKRLFNNDGSFNWDDVRRFARLPSYFKRISLIYNNEGCTDSNLAWLSFLVGNSSIRAYVLKESGLFDNRFTEWGFEHFELALRIQKLGYKFCLNNQAKNFHIPHPREENFYQNMINKSADKLTKIHPEVDKEIIKQLLNGEIDITYAENKIFLNKNYKLQTFD